MIKYRIVSNGLNYRVQWLGKTFFLRRLKWYWLKRETYARSYIATFPSSTKAQEAISQCKEVGKADKQGYIPV